MVDVVVNNYLAVLCPPPKDDQAITDRKDRQRLKGLQRHLGRHGNDRGKKGSGHLEYSCLKGKYTLRHTLRLTAPAYFNFCATGEKLKPATTKQHVWNPKHTFLSNTFKMSSSRNRGRPPLHPPKREKTPAEIIEEKMAAMAADPNADIVYWTEKGPDAKGWDIICPEYKILTEAFRGGYGWWDLTEGKGQHLLPKPKPYKIVHISSEELKVIRMKEAEAEAAAAAAAKAAKEAEYARYREAAQRKRYMEEMAAEDARAAELRAAERAAEEAAALKLAFYESRSAAILQEIRDLPAHCWCESYLVDYIVDRVIAYEGKDLDELLTRICPVVEKEGMLFYTPLNSPELPFQELAPPPPPLTLPPPLPMVNLPALPQFVCPPTDAAAFLSQPAFLLYDVSMSPAIRADGQRMYVPTSWLQYAIPYGPPPLPPQLQQMEMKCSDPICRCNIYPPLPPDCGDPACETCYPPPPQPAPQPASQPPPLPVIKAVLVESKPQKLPGLLPTPSTPPINIKIRKLRMPSKKRVAQLLAKK